MPSGISSLLHIYGEAFRIEAGALDEAVKAYADAAPDELVYQYVNIEEGKGSLPEEDATYIYNVYRYGFNQIKELLKELNNNISIVEISDILEESGLDTFNNRKELESNMYELRSDVQYQLQEMKSLKLKELKSGLLTSDRDVASMFLFKLERSLLLNDIIDIDNRFNLEKDVSRSIKNLLPSIEKIQTWVNSSNFMLIKKKVEDFLKNSYASSFEGAKEKARNLRWKGPWVSATQWQRVMGTVLADGYNDFDPSGMTFIPKLFGHLKMKLGREYSPVTYARGFQDGEDLISFMSFMAGRRALADEVHIIKPNSSKIYGDAKQVKRDARKILGSVGDPTSAVVRVWWD